MLGHGKLHPCGSSKTVGINYWYFVKFRNSSPWATSQELPLIPYSFPSSSVLLPSTTPEHHFSIQSFNPTFSRSIYWTTSRSFNSSLCPTTGEQFHHSFHPSSSSLPHNFLLLVFNPLSVFFISNKTFRLFTITALILRSSFFLHTTVALPFIKRVTSGHPCKSLPHSDSKIVPTTFLTFHLCCKKKPSTKIPKPSPFISHSHELHPPILPPLSVPSFYSYFIHPWTHSFAYFNKTSYRNSLDPLPTHHTISDPLRSAGQVIPFLSSQLNISLMT